jgi:glutamate carboxypeptidase
VYPGGDPFQKFEMLDSTIAHGPGVLDMKGGDVAMLYALIALRDAGVLRDANITVALMGDEEDVGSPAAESRAELVELAKKSDVALAFECAAGSMGAVSPMRLGFADWLLRISTPSPLHSGTELRTHPAYAEAGRLVRAFQATFTSEPYLQVYALGVQIDTTQRGALQDALIVSGGMRFLAPPDLQRAQSLMRTLAQRTDHGVSASIVFGDAYPGMAPRPQNLALVATMDTISRALGGGRVVAGDPRKRGGGDISFIAHLIPGLDGLGPTGSGAHSPDEMMDVPSLLVATKRAALLIHRLTASSN